MNVCKVDIRGRILEDSLNDIMGERGLTKEEKTWAKYISVDFDGTVVIWQNEPHPGHLVAEQMRYTGPFEEEFWDNRWVDPKFESAEVLYLPAPSWREREHSRVYKLEYEENKNEDTEKASPASDASRLVA